MQPLTCPIPSNINPLQSSGFMFDILKLPEVKFFCQEIALPSLNAPPADFSTPLSTVYVPGDKLQFGDLSIVFLIDENMANYIALHNWMVGLGFPVSHQQYANFLSSRTNSLNKNPAIAGYSDGVLSILNSTNSPSKTIRFIDVFPTSIQQVNFRSDLSTTEFLTATASFRYTYYVFE